ncbi:MAG: hypothetical protein H7X99_08705 [Saprospiraceae bacterium]|nr:hypothetical protein [Saprospiraceae bacterium]
MKVIILSISMLFLLNNIKAGGINDLRTAPIGDTITWLILSDLEYKETDHKEYGMVYLPEFSKRIRNLDNKQIIIKGYMVPVDKDTWALSKSTYASCFFCGKAGPETVVGLTFKGDPGRLKMDAKAIVTGKFILNGSDVDDWMYSMIDVEIISIK